jgi:hypothetical protein
MIRYYLPELGEGPEDAHELKNPPHYLSNAAEEAAEHFHSKRSGWECSWPLQFNIIDDTGKEHRFFVDRESVPQFRATEFKLR